MTSSYGSSGRSKGRSLRLGPIRFLVLLLALCTGQSAEGACLRLAGDGIGGTGLEAEDERIADAGSGGEDDGIGGMGLSDLSSAELDRFRGAGFTRDEAETSTMGIYGTITGLGSVCLNGLRVLLSDDAVLEQNDAGIARERLRVGNVVSVEAVNRDGVFAVARASLRPAIEGPVTGVEPGSSRLAVMGQWIELIGDVVVEDEESGELPLEAIEAGDFAVVHGLRGADGALLASHVFRHSQPQQTARVRGLLAGGTRALSIGDVPIEPIGHSKVAVGQWVLATGHWNPELESLENAQLEVSPPLAAGVERVSVEALISQGDAGRELFAAGLEIETSELAAQIIEELPEGTRLWLRGRLLSDDRLEILYFRVAPAQLLTPFGSSDVEEQWWQEQLELLRGASLLDVRRRAAPSMPLHAGEWTGRPVQAIRQGLIPR